LPEDEGNIEERETKIKKKRRTEEEEEEDRLETAILQGEPREQDRLEYEDALLVMEVSDEEDGVMVLVPREEPRRSKEGWMKAWTRTFDCHPARLSLFAMSTLLPPCRGVTVAGEPRSNEILIVGDVGREDIPCIIGHVLFLVHNGRKSRTTLNTREGYRWRVEKGDTSLERSLILFIDPGEFMMEGGISTVAPGCGRPGVASRVGGDEAGLGPPFQANIKLRLQGTIRCYGHLLV
jgi:hypothetical protein